MNYANQRAYWPPDCIAIGHEPRRDFGHSADAIRSVQFRRGEPEMKRLVLSAIASVLLLVSSVEARADHRHGNRGCVNNSRTSWHSFAGQGWYNGTQYRSPAYRSYNYRVPSYDYGYGRGYGNYGNYGYGRGYGYDNYGYGGCGNGYGFGNSNFRVYFGF